MLIDLEKIEQAKSIIAEDTPDMIAEMLSIDKWDSHNKKGCCPFHAENTPSFIWNKKANKFHCFGCNRNVDILDALMATGKTYIQAVQNLFDLAGINYSFGEAGIKTKRDYVYPHLEDSCDRGQIYSYLGKRCISQATIDNAGVTQDDEGNICFNYYDECDVLTMIKKRPSRKIKKGENKTWCQPGSDTAPLLFNMNKINILSPLVITEGECMKGDSQVLTPNGWVRLDEYNGEQVLQIDENLCGNFVTPMAYVKHEYDGEMYEKHNRATSYCVTANHNVVYVKNGEVKKAKASEMPRVLDGYIPCISYVDGPGIPLTNEQIALYLAVSADCTIDIRKSTGKRHSRFSAKKDRKYQRLKYLLDACGIEYYDNPNAGKGYKYLGFDTPEFIKDKFLPSEWIGQATMAQRLFIIEEMVKWDGNRVKTRNQYEYNSKEIHNAEVMQTIAHTCGYSATIIPRRNHIGEWYKVSILLNKMGVSHQDGFEVTHYNGMVYCVTVPTGMILVRQDEKIFVTGNCDCLALIESGITNSVSIPLGAGNTHWIEYNWDWLEQFQTIIICFDNDEAGVKARKEVVPRLGAWRTKYVEIPTEFKDENTNEIIPLKDVNEVLYRLGKEAVVDLIANAEDPGVPSVQNVSDIQDVDIDEMDGIVTGIKELDSEIMKLFYGTLTVVSGLPGAGKTSFLAQLACQSLEQDKPVWMFSREMPGWLEKNWLNYIMAGAHHVKAYEDENGAKYYKVNPDAKEKINSYYDKKWFLYRDDNSNKLDDILISMEDCTRKYGAKLLILDNLMSIDLESNENSELLKQTECISRLIKFAMKYLVAVVLVAHPRKIAKGEDVGMYDISGTSNIINLAHRTIGLRRINKDDEKSTHDVCLTILKDRMRGKAGKKIKLYYDIPSRRFYTNQEEYEYQYGWDNEEHEPLPYPHSEETEIYGE